MHKALENMRTSIKAKQIVWATMERGIARIEVLEELDDMQVAYEKAEFELVFGANAAAIRKHIKYPGSVEFVEVGKESAA